MSQPTNQQKHDQDDDDEPKASAWKVTPAGRMWPSRQGAEKSEDEDYEKQGSEHGYAAASFDFSR